MTTNHWRTRPAGLRKHRIPSKPCSYRTSCQPEYMKVKARPAYPPKNITSSNAPTAGAPGFPPDFFGGEFSKRASNATNVQGKTSAMAAWVADREQMTKAGETPSAMGCVPRCHATYIHSTVKEICDKTCLSNCLHVCNDEWHKHLGSTCTP